MPLQDLKTIPEWYDFRARYQDDLVLFAIEALGMNEAQGQLITWQQEQLFTSIQVPGSRTTVASGHGCFGQGTLVRLANGHVKAIEDVDLDDQLLSADGQSPMEVLDLFKGKEVMYQFNYSDGSQHIFNKSHILCLVANNTKGKRQQGQKITVTVAQWLMWSKRKQQAYSIYRLVDSKTRGKIQRFKTFAISYVECLGVGDYYGVMVDKDHRFVLADGTIVHNTGKTRSAGVVALWHLLCFPDSITMFTAPQIGQLKKQVWKEIGICLHRMRAGPWAWLAQYVVVLTEMVYIKGGPPDSPYKLTWHVYAKTAPKHQPSNIAGNHGDYYLLWVDEACGVPDEVMETVFGALTHPANRGVMTSQPARNAGFFFDSHHKLSHKAGGVWTALEFNGEESPIVGDDTLKEMLEKYGSRHDAGYMIRVRGKFPDKNGEYLLSVSQADKIYRGQALQSKHEDWGYVITVDVGGGVGRDDSVIMVGKVWGSAHFGEQARRVDIIDIPLCRNDDDIDMLLGVIDELMATYPTANLVVDRTGAGLLLGKALDKRGLYYRPVNWGGLCFGNDAKKEYANRRSQAIVCMTRAAASGRLKIQVPDFRLKLVEQITRLPYSFDDQSRFFVMSKKDFPKKGLKSPDLGDALAFFFLDSVSYIAAEEIHVRGGMEAQQVQASFEELARLVDQLPD